MKYRKRPVEIEAIRWDGREDREVDAFFTKEEHRDTVSLGEPSHEDLAFDEDNAPVSLFIKTLEGVMEAKPGDWVIRGTHGELYPIKAEIFEANYEPVG